MKPNNVIVFLGNSYELCKAFALFGKENLEYKSEFDHRIYKNSKYNKTKHKLIGVLISSQNLQEMKLLEK